MKVKEESEKAGLKLNIQKTKIMASGPITSWQIDGYIKMFAIALLLRVKLTNSLDTHQLHGKLMGKTMETVTDFIFLGSKITADSDCSHETKTLAP